MKARHKYSTNLNITPSKTMEGGITVHPQNVGFFYNEKGVELAIDTFLKHHVNEFKDKFYK